MLAVFESYLEISLELVEVSKDIGVGYLSRSYKVGLSYWGSYFFSCFKGFGLYLLGYIMVFKRKYLYLTFY